MRNVKTMHLMTMTFDKNW